jgi:hypothetical protein
MRRYLLAFLYISTIVFAASGQTISYNIIGSNYTQDFNALPNAGTYTFTSNGPLEITSSNGFGGNVNGWYVQQYLGTNNIFWLVDNGNATNGSAYSYGSTSSTDRAIGAISSTTRQHRFGALITNNTGGPINQIAISFYTEMWRRGDFATGNITNFEYKTNATNINDASGFVAISSLNLVTPNLAVPINTATDGNSSANRTFVTYIITGVFINPGEVLAIRWSDPNETSSDDGLAVDDFSFTGNFIAASSDYYRSTQSGDWSNLATWESSSDNINWAPAISTPTSTANTITIRNGHTVTLTSSVSADQVVIQNGGVLINQMPASNTFTIANGSDDDMDILSGGMYHILSTQGYANYQVIEPGATIRIRGGGVIRLGDGISILGGSSNHLLAATGTSYIWEHNSIFEWNSAGAFSTNDVTYFPDVDATTIPVFRTLVNTGTVGATANTTFNGIFEANGNITFENSGNKIFRNGIRGTGNVNGIASGTFIINGTTSVLGGTGSLTVPVTGLEIGSASGTTVTVTSNKTVTGNIHMQTTNTYIELGNNDLTVTGEITGESATSFVRTNGSGYLRLTDINTFISKLFPIGNTTYNPLVIEHAGTNLLEYYARVENGINSPGPLLPTYGINRTWYIGASAVVPSTNITFLYAAADANPGVLPDEAMEILRSDYTAWSILPGNSNILPVGTNPYTVTTATAITVNNSPDPYAIGKTGGYILPIDFFITAWSEKRNNDGIIGWSIYENGNIKYFEVQRSVNNSNYETIATISPTVNQLGYSYTDNKLPAGTSLYRIKVNRISGAVRYSNTVAIINDTKGLLITSVYPNPVSRTATVTLSAAKSGIADMLLYDISGTVVYRRRSAIAEGTNNLLLDLGKLPAGVYHLSVQSTESKAVYQLVKQ